jgi:hypothetical protein
MSQHVFKYNLGQTVLATRSVKHTKNILDKVGGISNRTLPKLLRHYCNDNPRILRVYFPKLLIRIYNLFHYHQSLQVNPISID